MSNPLDDLIARFRKAGCRDAEGWASSEHSENIPQYARFRFLQELWRLVEPKGSRRWLRTLKLPNDDGQGGVLRRLRASNASIDDLTELVREAQTSVVFDVAGLLDGYFEHPETEDLAWGLFEVDDNEQPLRHMGGLHESIEDPDVQPSSE